MSDVQMFWSLCAECVEFLSQKRSGAVLMESRRGEGQTDKQGLYQRNTSDRVTSKPFGSMVKTKLLDRMGKKKKKGCYFEWYFLQRRERGESGLWLTMLSRHKVGIK